MTFLIDTDYVIPHLAGQEEAVTLVTELRRGRLAISVNALMEAVEGVKGGYVPHRARHGLRAFLRGTRVLVVSRAVALRAADIRRDLRRRKRQVNERAMDILIAATATEHDLILVTRNIRDYEDILDRRLYQPT